MELKTPVMADGASTGESEFGTNLPEKEKADHDPSFCFHLLSFAVLASLPMRVSHNLTNGPYFCRGTLPRVVTTHTYVSRLAPQEGAQFVELISRKKETFATEFGNCRLLAPQQKGADHD